MPLLLLMLVQIGSFGGITPFESLLKNRGDLWDVAAAGPIAGIAASTALLAIGLSQSHEGGLPPVSAAVADTQTLTVCARVACGLSCSRLVPRCTC